VSGDYCDCSFCKDQHNVEKNVGPLEGRGGGISKTFGPIESGLWGKIDPGLKMRGTDFITFGPRRPTEDLARDPVPTHILDEARKVVYGRGESEYGHPFDDFSRTAGMLTALFADKLRPGAGFEPEDVAKIQICVKLSRSRAGEKSDHYVDIAGYAETAARVLWDPKPDG